MSPLPQERLEKALKLNPTAIAEITEDERWIRVGPVRVSKSGARVNVGFTHPTDGNTHFQLQQFASGDRTGLAIILSGAGKLPDYFAGWVPDAVRANAEAWVERLNNAIRERISHAKREIDEGAAAHILIFHLGSEYAPDSPWGGETLEMSTSGALDYEQRRSGTLVRSVRGEIDPSQVNRLFTFLAETTFPTPMQTMFPPGASVCTLITEPPFRSMPIDLYSGRNTSYEPILAALTSLAGALRESDEVELQKWNLKAHLQPMP